MSLSELKRQESGCFSVGRCLATTQPQKSLSCDRCLKTVPADQLRVLKTQDKTVSSKFVFAATLARGPAVYQPIHAYGFFVDLLALYNRKRGRPDSPDIDAADDVSRFLWDVEMELLAAGLHKLSIASVPTPKQFHTIYSGDEGWLVILGTGFDMTPHVPIPSEITERVRNIFKAEEPPGWWSMRWFTYPAPKYKYYNSSMLTSISVNHPQYG
ncbi:hypothetical protein B0J17DRAFT_709097 [Rhizoctonia solani]|nr:hypothetical protein B0J17DRAFT_709097 [Rhizoctonia solani]